MFDKQVNKIEWDNLSGLLADTVSENVRLEFKQEVPKRDETLKKITSFANTYGGFIIVGAAEDGKGSLLNLDGVDLQADFKQKVVQWCFENIYPPIIPVVSDPISQPDTGKFLYVIYIEESEEAPHFLNKRRGCYIRTDEYSQRFEARLGNLDEIEFLQNRRQKSVVMRDNTIERAKDRFEKHVLLN